jgi:hypothetical protein
MTSRPKREGMGRAAHVLLHIAHAGGGLEVQAAGVEHHSLADQGDQRQVGPVQIPADLDDAGRAMRGGGAADGVDGRIVLVQQGLAGDHGDQSAPALSAISRAMVSICSGPMSAAGVSTISRARAQAEAMFRVSPPDRRHRARPDAPVTVGPGLVAVECR